MPEKQISHQLSKERRYIICNSSGCKRTNSVPSCQKKEATSSILAVGTSEPTQSPVVKRKKIHYLYKQWVPANQLSPQLSKERSYLSTSTGYQRTNSVPNCQKKEATVSVLAVGARETARSPVVKRKKIHYLY